MGITSGNPQDAICNQGPGHNENIRMVDKEQTQPLSQWNKVRGKFAAKGGMHQNKNQLTTSNDISVFHDHDTRFVVAGGRDKYGNVGVVGGII